MSVFAMSSAISRSSRPNTGRKLAAERPRLNRVTANPVQKSPSNRDRSSGPGNLGKARSVKLRYTLPALADLDSILDYIAANSPQGARRVQVRLQQVIGLLTAHPEIGVRTDRPTIRRQTAHP
jgi:hypothetical protein